MKDWIGRTLGKVYIESLLARGGMAEVYLGTHTTLHRKVAVKILRNYHTDDLQPLERFELEARAVAQLRHPNIVQVFDFDTVEDQPYLVMEYISGPSMSKYLAVLHAKNGQLGLPLISRLLTRVAGALQYAHESGVIHRDVKPGNILLSSRSIQIVPGETLPLDLEPVLTDFGLVRFLNSSRQTASGLITGTPAYMSPEQALGQATDGRTDIYSLGIVLYEMLSGKVPFDGESTVSILLKHLNETPAPIPGLSPGLQRVLDKALAKNADDRFQEPEEFATAFSTTLEGTSRASTLVTIPEVLKSGKASTAAPSRERKRWMPAVLAAVMIALVGISLVFNWTGLPANEIPTTPAASDTPTDIPILEIPVTLGPTGILHFRDGNATLDAATLIAQAIPAAPADSQYEVWLVNEEERLPLGTLVVDGSGKGELTFDDRLNRNLLGAYHQVEITLETDGGADLNGAGQIAYAYALPDSGLVYLRNLMVSFPATPKEVGLIQGLLSNTELISEAANRMLNDHRDGNEGGVKQNAESILNLLVGEQNADYKDWDGDGQISDPGDGYGFLLNGDNLGYIQAVFSHADYAVNSSGATRHMVVNGEYVKVCIQNLASWVPELRDHMLTVLRTTSPADMDTLIPRSAELADLMLSGIDRDENGIVDPAAGECGALMTHEYAYRMADMPLLPVAVNPLDAPIAISETVTASATATTSIPFGATPTNRPDDDENGGTNSVPTAIIPTDQPPPPATSEPKPTQKPKPTDKPKPTKDVGPPNDPGPPNTKELKATKEPKPTKDK